ncbi:MAG TPA: rhodanese-like domain-containing protein [Clostridia bacterium]|nr:rhodanese-like domain-containing protein [Clostridia bacterium]
MASELMKNDPEKARQFFADKLAFTTGPVELARNLKQADIVVIDVREAEDYQKGHIPGALNLPHDRWTSLDGLRKDALNVLYCYTQQCHLAATAALQFASKGFPVMELEGGFEAWKENDMEIETETSERTGRRTIAVTA